MGFLARYSGLRWLDQVPSVAEGVLKHGDFAIGFAARALKELNARRVASLVIPVEAIGFEEKKYAPSSLTADGAHLFVSFSLSQQQAGFMGAGWGITTTQRFVAERGVSSLRAKPSAPT